MEKREKGEFYGQHKKVITCPNLVITDTVYTLDHVDWHYHEHAYFTFLLKGALLEINKKTTHTLTAGSLLFHHWQDAHYNIKPPGYAQGFHVELEKPWFTHHGIDPSRFNGSKVLGDPVMKKLFAQLHRETTLGEAASGLSIQGLLLQVFGEMSREASRPDRHPAWMQRVREILNDCFTDNVSLDFVAKEANVHPAHLSREFPRHFGITFGGYLRALRVARAQELLAQRHLSVAAIAYACGFADQSHLIRCFREAHGVTPAAYRKQT